MFVSLNGRTCPQSRQSLINMIGDLRHRREGRKNVLNWIITSFPIKTLFVYLFICHRDGCKQKLKFYDAVNKVAYSFSVTKEKIIVAARYKIRTFLVVKLL